MEIRSVLRSTQKNRLKQLLEAVSILGAQNKTRTCTTLRSLVPETSVSTNFTIWAWTKSGAKIKRFSNLPNPIGIFFGQNPLQNVVNLIKTSFPL